MGCDLSERYKRDGRLFIRAVREKDGWRRVGEGRGRDRKSKAKVEEEEKKEKQTKRRSSGTGH